MSECLVGLKMCIRDMRQAAQPAAARIYTRPRGAAVPTADARAQRCGAAAGADRRVAGAPGLPAGARVDAGGVSSGGNGPDRAVRHRTCTSAHDVERSGDPQENRPADSGTALKRPGQGCRLKFRRHNPAPGRRESVKNGYLCSKIRQRLRHEQNYRTLDALGRLRPSGAGYANDRPQRRPMAAHRRDGRGFRPQHLVRLPRDESHPQSHRQAAGRASDDRRSREVRRPLR